MVKTQTSLPGAVASMAPGLSAEGRSSGAYSIARPRSDWVDASKGLGITLVVVGHTLRGLVNAQLLPSGGSWGLVDRFIYAFHMPLFFFLSGLFLMPKAEEPYALFARRRIVRLGYPYLIWATLQTLVQVAMSRHTNNPAHLSDLWTISFAPPMQFWFLYALLLQVLCIGALVKLGLGRGAVLGVAALLFVSAPYVPIGGWLPLHQARDALVYTTLGLWMGEASRLRALERASAPLHLAVVIVGYAGVALYVAAGVTQHHLAFVPALLGSCASLSLCCLLVRAPARFSAHLSELGKASLAIFVAHTLASAAVRIALHKLLGIEQPALHLVAGLAAGLYVPFALYRLSQHGRFQLLFQWPERRAPSVRPTRT